MCTELESAKSGQWALTSARENQHAGVPRPTLAKTYLPMEPRSKRRWRPCVALQAQFVCALACVAFILPAGAGTGPPPNDDFSNRIHLPSGHILTNGFNGAATAESLDPALEDSAPGRSVWWSWTAVTSGPVTVTLRGPVSDPDNPAILLGIFQGDALPDLV